MGEHRAIPTPPANVEFIRDWLTPAWNAWTRIVFPPRRGFWFASGCIFWFIVLPVIAFKFAIYGVVVVIMCVLFLITGCWDMATYRHRLKAR
jgi:hypothetical protein